jgi:hypothetical protein
MALIVKDRVRETSTTTGTGTITLAGAVSGFQSFSVIGDGNTTYYTIVDPTAGEWEVGVGTYTLSGTTLQRNQVLESSSGGALINFASNTKDVFVTYPAEKSFTDDSMLDLIGTDPNEIPLNQFLGTMAYQDSNNVVVGNLTVTGQLNVRQELLTGSFTWNSLTSTPDSIYGRSQVVTGIHDMMRGCVLNADGSVNYYLNPTNWAQQANGTASVLTGADGNVMVEIPKFYYRIVYAGTETTWKISAVQQSGFVTHPAFIKDGVEVDFRYMGAYDACVYDDSASAYLAGLNLDDNTANVNTAADLLASVKGIYPMVGLTRDEFRLLAANVGTGWRQVDFALWSAVQMLYLTEYQSFYSQNILGAGNTNGGYLGSSGNQTDSPHTIAGAGDSIANGSTDATSGAGVNAKPGTSFMKYRGIENLFGNAFNWADGINVNVTAAGNVHVTNTRADFADNTSTNMTLITSSLSTATGFIRDLLPVDGYFLSSSNSGASSSTYITDQHIASTTSNRVVAVVGNAHDGAVAGAFCLSSHLGSSNAFRFFGGRLAY